MKKILWFLFGLGLAAGFGFVAWNTWQTAAYFQAHGRAGTVKIGAKYNTSRWNEPLPLSKVHTYVAVLAPDHELLLETDQNLTTNEEIFVKFLLRDTASIARDFSVRSLVGTLRLKSAEDGTPVRLADTNLFDRIVDKAMGPPAEGVFVRQRETAEAAPTRSANTVPFVFAGANASTIEVIWNNSSVGEWILAGLWLLAIKTVLLHARATPFDPTRLVGVERADFVHPSQRRIEADALAAPSTKLTYVAKPADHDYMQVAKPSPVAPLPDMPIPEPKSATPRPTQTYSTATTSPFVPVEGTPEPTLKLARKPKAPEPPAPPSPSAG